MSLIAGIISLEHILHEPERTQFLDAINTMRKDLPWSVQLVESSRSILVHSGFAHMWHGPKICSTTRYDAVASGVQWREIPNSASTLDYLTRAITAERYHIENFFDYFNCAIVDKEEDFAVLATDPIGICPLLHKVEAKHLVFSTHQTVFKRYLGGRTQMNWQAVLEYLIIGHCIGDKSLLEGVTLLPPGCQLVCKGGNARIVEYSSYLRDTEMKEMGLKEAEDAIFEHLMRKCESYGSLPKKTFAGLLSGGWDSRLLVSMFVRNIKMAMTYTTQQQTRINKRLISEKKIAGEVARNLGVKNLFIAPKYRTPKNRNHRARVLDYTTWFHDWAFSLAGKLPYDKYIFCDGLLGDILLRGLYITPELHACIHEDDRVKASELFHAHYLRGFNTYTRGVALWKSVIRPDLLDEFSQALFNDISRGLHDISSQDFVTIFLIRNRSRRGISPLPIVIFGRKGTIVFPFCDYEFVEKVLQIPRAFRLDLSLYKGLLERVKTGLSKIPSTNTKDQDELSSYLVDSVSDLTWPGEFFSSAKSKFPSLYAAWTRIRSFGVENRNDHWVDDVLENPPDALMDGLTSEIKDALRGGDRTLLKRYKFFLDRIKILDHFFS